MQGDLPPNDPRLKGAPPEHVRKKMVDDALHEFYIKNKPERESHMELAKKRFKAVYDKIRDLGLQIKAADPEVGDGGAFTDAGEKSMYLTLNQLLRDELYKWDKDDLLEILCETTAGIILEDIK